MEVEGLVVESDGGGRGEWESQRMKGSRPKLEVDRGEEERGG